MTKVIDEEKDRWSVVLNVLIEVDHSTAHHAMLICGVLQTEDSLRESLLVSIYN